MKLLCVGIVLLGVSYFAGADTFGTGENQFTIEFVPISKATNPTSGIPIGNYFTFTGVANDYRIGVFEITNEQWNKFKSELGVPVTGYPSLAYSDDVHWTGGSLPANQVSWYEAVQFVNWLNTSKGFHTAYKFTGTQGTGEYTFSIWDASEAWGGTNLYRHKDAFYFLPTEDEWVKAAYWNGMSIQTHATKEGDVLYQGDGTNGGWNYYNNGYATTHHAPWDVGRGSEELNGTFDMMGNILEWMEGPLMIDDHESSMYRRLRGGAFSYSLGSLSSSDRRACYPYYTDYNIGFRVASVPEPASLGLLFMGGVLIRRKLYLEKMHVRGR